MRPFSLRYVASEKRIGRDLHYTEMDDSSRPAGIRRRYVVMPACPKRCRDGTRLERRRVAQLLAIRNAKVKRADPGIDRPGSRSGATLHLPLSLMVSSRC